MYSSEAQLSDKISLLPQLLARRKKAVLSQICEIISRLSDPNILGDEGITQFLISHLDHELAQIDDAPALQTQTKSEIAHALSEGLPKMADIARKLGLSARSFHRRLAEHGLSFQTLTEETRREIATAMLQDERYSLFEVAFLTGYSEQSAFNRAFKRWMGMTPAAYRKSLG